MLVRSRTCFTTDTCLYVTITCGFPMARLSGRRVPRRRQNNGESVALLKAWHTRNYGIQPAVPCRPKDLPLRICRAGAVLMARCSVSR